MKQDNGNHAATPGDWENFGDFLRERIGSNWVVARRTKRLVERYGADVVALSSKEYEALCNEYERLTLRSAHNPRAPSPALSNTAPALLAKCEKIIKWLEQLAATAEHAAEDNRFSSLQAANIADAKNFRATADDIHAVVAKAKGESQ